MIWRERILWALLAAAAVLLAVNLAGRRGADQVADVAPPAPQVRGMAKVDIRPSRVKALPPKAKAALKLPETAASNPSIYALGAARIEPDFRPVTVTTTLDADTGEVQVYSKREPLPWIAIPHRGEAGIAYGIKDGQPAARLTVQQALLDIKALRLSATATLDQDGDTFAGVGLSYRW